MRIIVLYLSEVCIIDNETLIQHTLAILNQSGSKPWVHYSERAHCQGRGNLLTVPAVPTILAGLEVGSRDQDRYSRRFVIMKGVIARLYCTLLMEGKSNRWMDHLVYADFLPDIWKFDQDDLEPV